MAGFQLPITAIPPQLLAEMARAAFKPPALMSGGGGGGGGMGALPQSPGFNVGQGMAGMGQGLGMLAGALNKPPSLDDRTRAIDNEIADWSAYGSQGQRLGPSNASYGDLGGMGGTYGQSPGFFSGLFGRG